MKAISITIAIILTTIVGFSQNNLTAKINGLQTNAGTVKVKLLDANNKVVNQTTAKVNNHTCEVKFEGLKSGKYAVQYFHDENDNGKLDTGTFGRPVEGYGYSNDARGFMGPADFEDQIFEITRNLEISLKTVL
tara:strand:- start:6931 stop:7332 length:402 start_codon:yes stop_codon:yes gene_type:complete